MPQDISHANLSRNPDFIKLSDEKKIQFMEEHNPDFKKLPIEFKQRFIDQFPSPNLRPLDSDTFEYGFKYGYGVEKGILPTIKETGREALGLDKPGVDLRGAVGEFAIEAGKSLLERQKEELRKSDMGMPGQIQSRRGGPIEYAKQGTGERLQATGHLLAGALPIFGPAASEAVEDMTSGHGARGAGKMTATLTQILTPEVVKGVKGGAKAGLTKLTGPLPLEKQLAKLSAVSGASIPASTIEEALPEMNETLKYSKTIPKTPKEYLELAEKTGKRIDTPYNLEIQKNAGIKVIPKRITDNLEALAKKAEATGHSSGIEKAKAIRAEAVEFKKPYSVRQLDAQRKEFGGKAARLYNEKLTKLLSTDELKFIDKAIADGARDTLYDDILPQSNNKVDWRKLKSSQGALIELQSELKKVVETLKTEQKAIEGGPIRGGEGIGATVHPTGIYPRVHFGQIEKRLPSLFGPEVKAGRRIKKAFRGRAEGLTPLQPSTSPQATPKPPAPSSPAKPVVPKPQGGHAGGGVSSVEELNRPGVHYVINKSGEVTYHGKSFDPGSTRQGSAHITAFGDGSIQVNAGQLTQSQEASLKRAFPGYKGFQEPKSKPKLTAAQTKELLESRKFKAGNRITHKGTDGTIIGKNMANGQIVLKMADGTIQRVNPEEIQPPKNLKPLN